MEKKDSRLYFVDAAKVVAILVVVWNHSGLYLPGVNFWGGIFYVPAFFLLAGYTYKQKQENYATFVKRKAIRLLVPYATANLLLVGFFTLKEIFAGMFTVRNLMQNLAGVLYARNRLLEDAEQIAFLGIGQNGRQIMFMRSLNAPTWFLPALFLTLIVGELLFRSMKGNSKVVAFLIALMCISMVVWHYATNIILPWGIDILPFTLSLFIVGYLLREKRIFEKLYEKPLRAVIVTVLLAVLAISVTCLNGSVNISVSMFGKSVMAALLAAIAAVIVHCFLMYVLEKVCTPLAKALATPARYTLTILLYHYFIMQMFHLVMVSVFGCQEGVFLQLLAAIVSIVGSVLLACLYRFLIHAKRTEDKDE
ncbi:MAG: acyltransferase [Lachnospiraceae bacterium]|nr:acyltransferase [Lachnospiraceae bacterium]